MIAPRDLPDEFIHWNRRWGSPFGRDVPRWLTPWLPRQGRLESRWRGPFAYQSNSTTRRFEFPWTYGEIAARGQSLDVVEIGGGLSGMQFVLAGEGHRVINVDPGVAADGRGWKLDVDAHARLCRYFGAPVDLRSTTISGAGLADASVDVLLCISAIEHFAPAEVEEVAEQMRRVLRPGGIAVLTIDLFLDLCPFTREASNHYGRNLDVRSFLAAGGLELRSGEPAELLGFDEFSSEKVLADLSRFAIGESYPALSQCLVAGLLENESSASD
jgi:SAM-dependent methyltransferase